MYSWVREVIMKMVAIAMMVKKMKLAVMTQMSSRLQTVRSLIWTVLSKVKIMKRLRRMCLKVR